MRYQSIRMAKIKGYIKRKCWEEYKIQEGEEWGFSNGYFIFIVHIRGYIDLCALWLFTEHKIFIFWYSLSLNINIWI